MRWQNWKGKKTECEGQCILISPFKPVVCSCVCVYAHMCTCVHMYIYVFEKWLWEFPGGSVVRVLCSHCRDMSSIPGWELKKKVTQVYSHGNRTQLPHCYCWLIDLHSLFVNILLGNAAVIRTETKDLNGLLSLMTQKETLRENPLRWISQPK